jgi:hypothetical protein
MPADDVGERRRLLPGRGWDRRRRDAVDPKLATALAHWLTGADAQEECYVEAGGQPANSPRGEDDACNAATIDFFRGTRLRLAGASGRRWPG